MGEGREAGGWGVGVTFKQIDFILELAERDGFYIEELVERFPKVNWAKAKARRESAFRKRMAALPPNKCRMSLHDVNEILKDVFSKSIDELINTSNPLRDYLK